MQKALFYRASITAIVAAIMPTAGLAQTAPVGGTQDDPALEQSSGTQVGSTTEVNADGSPITANEAANNDIVITGSRIRLPNIQNLEPTIGINQRYLQDRGITNVADALNEIPGIRGSITPAGAQGSFGQGVNFVNTFGLGSNRTLTLVNGRRYVSSNVSSIFNQGSQGTQVDVNVIPTLLISNVDFVSIGGAPLYGSDAIAGTINYTLDTRLKGLRAQVTSSVTQEGDGFRYNAAIAGGFDFAGGRGNITLAYTRDEQKGILGNARGFIRDNIGGAGNPTTAQAAALGRPAGTSFTNDGRLNGGIGFNDSATDGFPGTVQVVDRTIPLLTRGGLITSAFANANGTGAVGAATQNFQFDPSGNLVPFNRGIRFLSVQEASGGDGFRFNDFVQLTSELKRDIFNGFAAFDVSDALKFFAEGTYFHSRGDELVQQPTFNSSLFGGLSGATSFSVDNPFLTQQAATQLRALGVNRFSVSRASLDLSDPTGFSTNNLYRGVIGVKGDFGVGSRKFNYEVSGNYGRVDITDTGQDLNAQNFINAVNVTRNAAGQIVCNPTPTFQAAPGGTPTVDAACVPLNLFGEGAASQAARDYVISTNVTTSRLEQYVFNANVGGSPFALFGNDVGFNIGYEHREEKASFTPSAFQQAGLGRSVAILPVKGKYNVDEAFGEVIVPLVTAQNSLPFVNSLDVFGRGRYVDNTVNGGFFAWAAGGRYAPVEDISFRGNYTKSFRAPAITELFSPQTNVFTTVTDICSPANINAGAVPQNRAANCGAFLAAFPNATPLDAAATTVPGINGGNPLLDNEVARSFTYGVVLQPRFIPGFSLSVDYIRIKISNPISSLTVATIAQSCFDNSSFNAADPANGNAFCSQIRRYAAGQGGTAANGGDRGGQVINDPVNPGVTSGFINGNQIRFSGIQAQMDYIRPLSGLGLPGRAGIDGTFFYTRRRVNDITGVAPVRIDGTLGDPTFQGQLNVRYIGEGFGFTMSANYIGEQLFSRVTRGPDIREVDELNDFVLFNPNVYFDVDQQFRLTFSVTNLTNRKGQNYFGYVLPASQPTSGAIGGDPIGRRFAVTARAKF
ncbi:TonB-dependent receptor domain-containing protein [Sphingomonas sp. CFBP 8765]|uniref:TonB-dependent receptor domain-containing protein n=1 Tax=Sphingomonas sp. CFBP 8765 TaxID=2775274 RepID=UPI0020179496|nr:TonB-dependent receptor [Sphingomonas sp. CFBP 8765]